jgi:hypothetical protein
MERYGGENEKILEIGRNTKMDIREIGINGANWIWLAQNRVQWQAFVNMVTNLWVP